MEVQLALKIFLSLAFLYVFNLFIRLYNAFCLKPEKLRSKLRNQGINGPPPSFLLGNIPEMKRIQSTVPKVPQRLPIVNHDCTSIIFPYFEQWRKEYGKVFMFSVGNVQLLYVTHPDVVKDMTLCTSLDLGKPEYQQKERGALLGQGILTSNGAMWVHQNKVIAPELYMDKVKGMVNIMVDATINLTKSWETKIESEGGVAEIRVDTDLRIFSSFVISKALFGNSYAKGTQIFLKFRGISKALSKPTLLSGIPGLRYLPSKGNRELWRLEKELYSMILSIVKERTDETSEKDLLQSIIDGAKTGNLGPKEAEQFIVDNCKNIYVAGYETTTTSSSWTLMLLASHPEWQDRVRAEIVEVCGGHVPDADMLRKMKMTTMVIQESLRLYPPAIMSREALNDMKFGDIDVPKGVTVWISVLPLHHDPEIWGPDAHKFNPERFANGLNSACKFPHTYMPFGVGRRICAGQNFAIAELKIVLAIILSKFSFTLSPKYRHSPSFGLVIEPEYGVDLIMKRV